MKVLALKRRADTLAEEAHACRAASRAHARRSLLIVRRRVGSPAGLAICFSLGFLAGLRRKTRSSPREKATGVRREEGGFARLVSGPVGEAVLKLVSAIVASFLMKYLNAGGSEEVTAPDTAAVH